MDVILLLLGPGLRGREPSLICFIFSRATNLMSPLQQKDEHGKLQRAVLSVINIQSVISCVKYARLKLFPQIIKTAISEGY